MSRLLASSHQGEGRGEDRGGSLTARSAHSPEALRSAWLPLFLPSSLLLSFSRLVSSCCRLLSLSSPFSLSAWQPSVTVTS